MKRARGVSQQSDTRKKKKQKKEETTHTQPASPLRFFVSFLPRTRAQVWFDMTTIRSRFFDCPSEEIKMKALTVIAMEARAAPTMKRKKMNNVRAAAKRKPSSFRPPPTSEREKKRKEKADGEARAFADLNFD